MPSAGVGYWQGRLDRVQVKTYFGLTFFTAHVGYEKRYQDPAYDYEGSMITANGLTTRDLSKFAYKAQDLAKLDDIDNPRFYRLGVF